MNKKNQLACLIIFLSFGIFGQKTPKTYLFIGTYTQGKPDKGIYIYEFNSSSGKVKRTGVVENVTNPSYLAISPNGRYLYACTETKLSADGNITAFKIDSLQGKVTFINKQPSGGKNPVYLTVHKNNRFIVNGNYSDGSVSVFKNNEDGSIKPLCQLIHFKDSSVNKERQESSHIHSTVFSPDYEFIYFPDLGADKIRVFKFDTINDRHLQAEESYTIKSSLGSGPRHFTFHPSEKFAYCIEELSGMVAAYSYNEGKLEEIQRTFSYSKTQESYGSADIHISPDGLFLYTSNRWENENTIAIFSINQANGQLTLIGHQKTFGDHPRNFTIDPTGKFLLVANQSTGNIVVFKRDLTTGLLAKTKYEIKVPRPACLQMRTYN